MKPAVITEDPLASHPPEIESATEMGARIRSRAVFVECRKDDTEIEGQEVNRTAYVIDEGGAMDHFEVHERVILPSLSPWSSKSGPYPVLR